MENLTKYILFVLTKNDNPQEFAEQIAEELSVISDIPKVNFYFGPESTVYTISTLDSYQDVKDYVDMILDYDTISYFLVPYTNDNLSYGLPDEVAKHLFNDGINDYMSGKNKICDENDYEVRTMLMNNIRNEFFLDLSEFVDEDDDDDISQLKNKKRTPTFDELFDKLADGGIESLSKEELQLLNQYSK
jgi:hypothetical protein